MHADSSLVNAARWDRIVSLYDTLLSLRGSAVIALQRALAIAERDGPERGLTELRAIPDTRRLARYPFYFAALGELEFRRGERDLAAEQFRRAYALARNDLERRFLNHRLAKCSAPAGDGHQGP